ncbi:MAG: hypothetical protein ACW97Z_14835 [Candidatus Hodarchaeales archaeon]|jgi:hypothetical protein
MTLYGKTGFQINYIYDKLCSLICSDLADNKGLKTIFSFREDRLRDLRLEGEATRKIPPDQRLRIAFEFLEFSEALHEAGSRSVGDSYDED